MIVIVDYGSGNVGSLFSALRKLTPDVRLSGDPSVVRTADAAVLPGDGAFGATMEALRDRHLLPEIEHFIDSGKSFLGICVGMQILYEGSDEHGGSAGLGIFPGRVARFVGSPRIPHIGWTAIEAAVQHPFVEPLEDINLAYFMHSYRAPVNACTLATAHHGEVFTAVAGSGNVVGTQFHPEKSQRTGMRLLDGFVRRIPIRITE